MYCLMSYNVFHSAKEGTFPVSLRFRNFENDLRVVQFDFEDYVIASEDVFVEGFARYEHCERKDVYNRKDVSLRKWFYGRCSRKKKDYLNSRLRREASVRSEHDVDPEVKVTVARRLKCGEWYNVDGEGNFSRPIDFSGRRPELVKVFFHVQTFFSEQGVEEVSAIFASYTDLSNVAYLNGGGLFRHAVDETLLAVDAQVTWNVVKLSSESRVLELFVDEVASRGCDAWVGWDSDRRVIPLLAKRWRTNFPQRSHDFPFACQPQPVSRTVSSLDVRRWVQLFSKLPKTGLDMRNVMKELHSRCFDFASPERVCEWSRSADETHRAVRDGIAACRLVCETYVRYVEEFLYSLAVVCPMSLESLLRSPPGRLCDVAVLRSAIEAGVLVPELRVPKAEDMVHYQNVNKQWTPVGGRFAIEVTPGWHSGRLSEKFTCDRDFMEMVLQKVPFIFDRQTAMTGTVVSTDDRTDCCEAIKMALREFERNTSSQDKGVPFEFYEYDVRSMYPNIMLTCGVAPHAVHKSITPKRMEGRHLCDHLTPTVYFGYRSRNYNLSVAEFRELGFSSETSRETAEKAVTEHLRRCGRSVLRPETSMGGDVNFCLKAHPFFLDVVRQLKSYREFFKSLSGDESGSQQQRSALKSKELSFKTILNACYGWLGMKNNRWGEESVLCAAAVCQIGKDIIDHAEVMLEVFSKPVNINTDSLLRKVPTTFPTRLLFELECGTMYEFDLIAAMLNYKASQKVVRDDPPHDCIQFVPSGPFTALFVPTSSSGHAMKQNYVLYGTDFAIEKVCGLERSDDCEFVKDFKKSFFYSLGEVMKNMCSCNAESAGEEGEQRYVNLLEELYRRVFHRVVKPMDDFFESRGRNVSETKVLECLKKTSAVPDASFARQDDSDVSRAACRLSEFKRSVPEAVSFVVVSYNSSPPQAESVVVKKIVVPVDVFSESIEVRKRLLGRWMGMDSPPVDPKSLVDWKYYADMWGRIKKSLFEEPVKLQVGEDVRKRKHVMRAPRKKLPPPLEVYDHMAKLASFQDPQLSETDSIASEDEVYDDTFFF